MRGVRIKGNDATSSVFRPSQSVDLSVKIQFSAVRVHFFPRSAWSPTLSSSRFLFPLCPNTSIPSTTRPRWIDRGGSLKLPHAPMLQLSSSVRSASKPARLSRSATFVTSPAPDHLTTYSRPLYDLSRLSRISSLGFPHSPISLSLHGSPSSSIDRYSNHTRPG
jgi:hypothetical protein